MRPTVRFTIAFALTFAWVAFSVWVSEPWRGELEAAIGPVMGWVIPLFLAYIPGFMKFIEHLQIIHKFGDIVERVGPYFFSTDIF